jgi:hypothetical protein
VLADESLKSLHLAPIERPLLLVDVDGVISLFGFDPSRPPEGRFELVDGIAHFISATAGEHLCTVLDRFDLVWCTGWEEKANEYLAPELGLPGSLPHLALARTSVVRTPTGSSTRSTAASGRGDRWRGSTMPSAKCEAWASRRAAPLRP